MKILLLGNSFTYYHDMPQILAALTGWDVTAHTRGGAWLDEHLDPACELGTKTLPALRDQHWDYVVLQEYSNGPITDKPRYLRAVEQLCALARAAGAAPVIYASWAYKEGSDKLATTGMTYAQMDAALTVACHEAARLNHALVADVGRAFTATRSLLSLYEPADDYHPTREGSVVIAHEIIRCISCVGGRRPV